MTLPRWEICPHCNERWDSSGRYTSPANRAKDRLWWDTEHLSGACRTPSPERTLMALHLHPNINLSSCAALGASSGTFLYDPQVGRMLLILQGGSPAEPITSFDISAQGNNTVEDGYLMLRNDHQFEGIARALVAAGLAQTVALINEGDAIVVRYTDRIDPHSDRSIEPPF